MKLRIRDNTIRFRLNRSEVQRLADGHAVEQVTQFSPIDRLVSRVVAGPHAGVRISFQASRIELRLPAEQVARWASTSEIAIVARQRIDDVSSLEILIEKDFECLHASSAENQDAFPNPFR